MLPGREVVIRDNAPPRGVASDTGTGFVTGIAERGPLTPVLVRSLDEFEATFGVRVTYGLLWDVADVFFSEGGTRLYVSRVVGPAAVVASVNVFDQSGSVVPGDVALIASGKGPGAYSNDLNVVILTTTDDATIPAGYFRVRVTHDVLGTLETSPDLLDRAAAVAWARDVSAYIVLTEGTSAEDPRSQGPLSLTGGNDDRAAITETQWTAALDRFTADLGPGQVAAPGRTTTAAHQALDAHAEAQGRRAIKDLADVATTATLTGEVVTSRTGDSGRFGGFFAPWAVGPGVTAGSTRTVPYSAVQLGLTARNDGSDGTGNPNAPVAGENGISRWATGLSQVAWTDAQRQTLNEAGVNVARLMFGSVRTYGNVTGVDQTADPNWKQLSGSREMMALAAEGGDVLERFVHRQIDRASFMGQLNGELSEVCQRHYEDGALYGDTPDDAYNVETGDAVNPPLALAGGAVKAVIAARTSPGSEKVRLELVRVPITEAVA